MLYPIFIFLERNYDFFGAGLFQFITFRAGMAMLFALLISIFIGRRLIKILQKMQIGETVRDLGLEGQIEKTGTPTMGGIIIILAIIIPTMLFAKLTNIYIILLLGVLIWMSTIGFIDDYIKVFKKDKQGLRVKTKLFGQIIIGLIVGTVLYFHEDVVVQQEITYINFANVKNFDKYKKIIPINSSEQNNAQRP